MGAGARQGTAAIVPGLVADWSDRVHRRRSLRSRRQDGRYQAPRSCLRLRMPICSARRCCRRTTRTSTSGRTTRRRTVSHAHARAGDGGRVGGEDWRQDLDRRYLGHRHRARVPAERRRPRKIRRRGDRRARRKQHHVARHEGEHWRSEGREPRCPRRGSRCSSRVPLPTRRCRCARRRRPDPRWPWIRRLHGGGRGRADAEVAAAGFAFSDDGRDAVYVTGAAWNMAANNYLGSLAFLATRAASTKIDGMVTGVTELGPITNRSLFVNAPEQRRPASIS